MLPFLFINDNLYKNLCEYFTCSDTVINFVYVVQILQFT